MSIRRIAAASAFSLMMAGTGLAICLPAHATVYEGYDCATVTFTASPRAQLNLVVNATDCTAVNGAPTSGSQYGDFAFNVNGVMVGTCSNISLDSYPATVIGVHCAKWT
jgi:hypothetical protein